MVDTGDDFNYNKRIMKQVKDIPLRDYVAKDLRTPKYRMRKVELKTGYKRKVKNQHDYNLRYL